MDFTQILPGLPFRTVYALLYIVHSLYIVHISCHILFSNELFCNYSNILATLFQLLIIADYHPLFGLIVFHLVIVHYSDTGNVCQFF